jgi:hypothetical protein
VAPCGFNINRRFAGTCHLHLQGRRNNASYLYVNYIYILNPHGTTSQKTTFFILTTVKTSNERFYGDSVTFLVRLAGVIAGIRTNHIALFEFNALYPRATFTARLFSSAGSILDSDPNERIFRNI